MDGAPVDRGDHRRATPRRGVSDADQPRLDERRPRGRRSLAFDVALALLAVGVGLVEIGDEPGVSAVLLTVVGGGALALRRLAPLVVLATTLVAATAMVAIDAESSDPIEAAGLTVLIAVYTVGAMCERRVSLTALVPAAAVVAVLSASTADVEGRETSALGGAIIATALTVGIWGLGAYAQTRRHYLRELEERAVQAEREREQLARIAVHEERASIARELHDIVAHSVSVMLVGVRGARDVLRTTPAVADDTLVRVERSGDQSLAELRRILALLRDPEHDAESRPQPSLADLDELVADYRAAGLPVRLETTGEPQPLPGGVELSVYRIVQEALTNVLKHSDPTNVTVTLSFRDSAVELEVVDDGTRAEPGATTTGQGIIGMRERIVLLGGELETGRRVGGGFRVAAWLPVEGDA
jgi:signal transduction histidine kinase